MKRELKVVRQHARERFIAIMAAYNAEPIESELDFDDLYLPHYVTVKGCRLRVSFDDGGYDGLPTVFCRWVDVKAALAALLPMNSLFTGKWNIHEKTCEACLSTLENNLKSCQHMAQEGV